MSSKVYRKIQEVACILLLISVMGTTFSACSASNQPNYTHSENGEKPAYGNSAQKPTVGNKKLTLESINAQFSDTTWHGKPYVKIEEESLLQIIRVAMDDAKALFLSLDAPGMTILQDGTSTRNPDQFYNEWQDEYFFLARAKRESGNFMIDFVGDPVDDKGNRAIGVMSIVPAYTLPNLDSYFKTIFKSEQHFSDLDLMPEKQDLDNYKTSKTARDNLKMKVYLSVYSSICNDIYNTKCTGPNHPNYYAKTGGFKEESRQKVVTALYLFIRKQVIDSLIDGSFENRFGNSSYVQDILKLQNEYRAKYERGIEME